MAIARRLVIDGVRYCVVCRLPKMAGRTPSAGKCLDCANQRVAPELRKQPPRKWRNGWHTAVGS